MEENSQSPNQKQTESTIPSPSQVFKGNKFTKTHLLLGGLVILTIVLLAITLGSKRPLPFITRVQAPKDFAHTSLSISDHSRASGSGSEVDINIDTNKNTVTGVELALSYDPKALSIVDIKPGSFFPNSVVLKKTIDPVKGTILFVLGISTSGTAKQGSGPVAILSYQKVGTGETTISFLPDTLVAAQGENESVLSKTVSGTIGQAASTTQ